MLSSMRNQRWAVTLLTIFLGASLVASQSISMDYCSTINTGSGSGNYSDYQSDGLCNNFCKAGKYGLAIVQGNVCWCSNTMPSEDVQVSLDRCKDPCPGFPSDVCGGDGTWGYMRIRSNAVTATAGGSSAVTTTAKQDVSTSKAPGSNTAASSPPNFVTTTIIATQSSPWPAAADSKSTQPPQIETVTADGTTKIVTVSPTNGASAAQSNAAESPGRNEGGGGLNTGAAVGIAIGVVAILVIGGVASFFFMRRKRRQDREAQEALNPEGNGAGMSQASAGFATRRPTNGTWASDHSSGRRSSMPDPRMKPTAGLYGGTLVNRSRDSFDSLQDNQDYSRPVHQPKVLKITNLTPNDVD